MSHEDPRARAVSRPNFCPECGTPLKPGMKFCPKCGISTSSWFEEPEPQDEPVPAPQPEPKDEPAPAPQPVPKDEPAPAPQPVPKDEPAPAPQPEPKDEPAPAPQPVPKDEPAPAPQPVPKAEPVPAPQPVPKAEPAPAPQPEPKAEPAPAPQPTAKAKAVSGDSKQKTMLIAGGVAALALVLVFTLGRGGKDPKVPAGPAGDELVSSRTDFAVEILKDEEGRITQEPFTLEDGTPVRRVYEYYGDATYITDMDQNGNTLVFSSLREDGTLRSRSFQDENGNTSHRDSYNAKGELESSSDMTYDSMGQEMTAVTRDASGKVISNLKNTYEDGRKVRVDYLKPDGSPNTYTLFAYNKAGYVTQMTAYDQDGFSRLTLTSYDEDNNALKTLYYNNKGELIALDRYTYDKNGVMESMESSSSFDDNWSTVSAGEVLRVTLDGTEPVPVPETESRPESEPEPKPERTSENYYEPTTLGTWEGSTFVNDYLGFRVTLDGFQDVTPGHLKPPAADDESLTSTEQNYWTTNQMFYDLSVRDSSNQFISILYQIIPRDAREYMIETGEEKSTQAYASSDEQLENARAAEARNGITLLSTEAVALDFRGEERWGLLQAREIQGIKLYAYTMNFPDTRGRYAVTVSLSAPSLEELDELLASFQPLD